MNFFQFFFSDDLTLVSYIPKKNRSVCLLSSEIHDSSIEQGERKRPTIILHYNQTKGAVDNGDRTTQLYSCARTTRRWPLRMFFDLIDICAFNCYILWIIKFPDWRKSDRSHLQYFLKELVIELSQPNVLVRQKSGSCLRWYTKHGIDLFNKCTESYESDLMGKKMRFLER
mgnify:CR=1 FL=1